ncbi:Transcription factor myb3r-5 [Gamsiella multidivaricata]|nr:Transcription factor myb3r-5 [Gamsiella multidivaricata]
MTFPLLAGSRMRDILSAVGKTTTKAGPCLLRNDLRSSLRLPHTTSPYRFVSLSTLTDRSALVQDQALSEYQQPHAATSATDLEHVDSNDGDATSTNNIRVESEVESTGTTAPGEISAPSLADSSYNTKYRKPTFTPEIDAEILRRRELGLSWTAIGSALGLPHRSCNRRYITVLNPLLYEHWPEHKSQILDDMVAQGKSWAEIAQALGTTSTNCQAKWKNLVRPKDQGRNRQFDMLQSKHGTSQWEVISEALKFHSPEQCKEKWTTLDMKTRPFKEKAWYKGERSNFWRLWQRYGTDWAKISGFMSRRSPEQCERFFKTLTAGFNEEDKDEFDRKVKELADSYSQYTQFVWKKEDSDRLWDVAEQVRSEGKDSRIEWEKVAERMGLKLTPVQYKHHHYYLKTIRKTGLAGKWSDEEIRTLERAVREVGRDWALICQDYLPHRNPKAICHKFTTIKHKGSHISPEEYETLMSKIDLQEEASKHEQGDGASGAKAFVPDWNAIARSMPGGTWTADQCRDAYESSFRNHLRKSVWTPKQDSALLEATKIFGRKNWIKVAERIPEKDTWECRLRWSELHETIVENKELAAIQAKTIRSHPHMANYAS